MRGMLMIYPNVGALIEGQKTISLGSQASVQEAAEKMAANWVGAIPVIDSDVLKGLFTERDLRNRVVAKGLRAEDARLEDVMTKAMISVQSDSTLVRSLSIMFEHKFRHLPVMEGDRLIGIGSCRDIPATYWMMWENWLAAQNELKAASA
jgi:CBS domain-containing protein